ncbi:hypothetical protein O5O45_14305 [Hahella aquimaris]|uniref:hypothetical protein n=1 Tax=Hahella sp. HNIBRBA332 TaxID=3015983 RepID=UPI00273BC39F|nr:hypothetical protein [Hahella sp. HNIBRBA332]WLQ17089.1 hypothetical protein O5O45_14305 [Hahella sp. HNIBRBA332]
MKPDEFMKKYGFVEEDEKEHSLQENAKERARHLHRPNSGTPFDWEDWERYRKEHDVEEGEAD